MDIHIIEKAYAERIVYHNHKAIGVVAGDEFQPPNESPAKTLPR